MSHFLLVLFLLFTIHYSLFTNFVSAQTSDYFICSPTLGGCRIVSPSDCACTNSSLCGPADTYCSTLSNCSTSPRFSCSILTAPLPTPTSPIVPASISPLCTIGSKPGIKTPIGCLPYADDSSWSLAGKTTVSALLAWSVRLGGPIALLLILYAAFKFTSARGDPKAIQSAQELLGSALAGLALISLALVTLNAIGVRILGLTLLGFNL